MAIEILGWEDPATAGAAVDTYAGFGVPYPAYAGAGYEEIVGDAAYAGDLYSGELYSGDLYAGDLYSGDLYAGDLYSGEMYAGDNVAYGDQAVYGADPDLRNLLAVTGAAPMARPRRAAPIRRVMPARPPMRPPMRMPAPMRAAAPMQARAPAPPRIAPGVHPQAVQVVEKPAEGLRAWAIGLDSNTPIPGGATQTVTTQPQVLFRGERLTVPNDIAGDSQILDLKIGNRSQLASGQFGLPARAYVETAIDNSLHMDTAQISQFIQMLVQNTSSQPRRFTAQIKGKAVIP
jgi:hypothetical protein